MNAQRHGEFAPKHEEKRNFKMQSAVRRWCIAKETVWHNEEEMKMGCTSGRMSTEKCTHCIIVRNDSTEDQSSCGSICYKCSMYIYSQGGSQ